MRVLCSMGRRRRKKPPAGVGQAGAGAPTSFLDATAYRRAEKAYRHYKHEGAMPTDFSEVIDCHDLEHNTEQNRQRLRRVATPASHADLALYELVGCPGLYLAPGALSVDEQCELAHSATTTFHQAPNATNLSSTVQQRDDTKPEPEPEPEPEPRPELSPEREPETATLDRLSRLRWATLGYQYQWTSRTYVPGKVTAMPARLSEICSALAGATGHSMEPHAAIVNYYNPKVRPCPGPRSSHRNPLRRVLPEV
jgi:alkylated DNA repair protein alkB family protein 1